MKDFLKNVVKNTLLAFAVGALLGAIAPALATGLGLAPSAAAATEMLGLSAKPLWLGAFFGAWGAFSAAISPVTNWMFGDKSAAAQETVVEKTPVVVMAMESPGKENCGCKHRDALTAQRAQLTERQLQP